MTIPSTTRAPDLTLKILLVGDIQTGKTSFARRFSRNEFSNNYRATIGVDFCFKEIILQDDYRIKIQLWDIAGQERFGSMTRAFYKDAHGALVLFDVSQQKTFEGAKKWKSDVDNKVSFPGSEDKLPCILVANKIDLLQPGKERTPSTSTLEKLEFDGWIDTSVKDNIGVDEAIKRLVEKILPKLPNQPQQLRKGLVTLHAQDSSKDDDSCLPDCLR